MDSFPIFHRITLVKSMNGQCGIMEYYRKAQPCSYTCDGDKSGVEENMVQILNYEVALIKVS